MTDKMVFEDSDVELAASQEEAMRLNAQVKYLSERVVILRATSNKLTNELNKLKALLEDSESEKGGTYGRS